MDENQSVEDWVALQDQAKASIMDMADMFSSLYTKLRDDGVPEGTCHELTMQCARFVWTPQTSLSSLFGK